MNERLPRCPVRWATVLSILITVQFGAGRTALAQDQIGTVTLLSGSPRMVGESIRPLQAILSGQLLETGEADAAGIMVEDIVVHVGANSLVTLTDEPGVTRVAIERGFVVFYTDPTTRTRVVVETPLGNLVALPATAKTGGSGWYSVRHDPEQVDTSPAVSTFATMEGIAEVAGTNPIAGPHTLLAGQRWQITQGQAPGSVEAGDERAAAQELRETLHRQSIESLRPEVTDPGRLAVLDDVPGVRRPFADLIDPDGQLIIDPNSTGHKQVGRVVPDDAPPIDFGPPTVVAAGDVATANAQFVSYDGTPANQNYNDFLASVDGSPAYQPTYLTALANGGFSYLQIAGPGAEVTTNGTDTFLYEDAQSALGWALYTPLRALSDSGFAAGSPTAAVVSAGFEAIARGDHLTSGGAIGGNGDPGSAFAIVADGSIQLNPNLPVGYPVLDSANQTAGLEVNGNVPSDQLAALGAGLEPLDLSVDASQLVFISNGQVDSLGNQFNFNGDAIEPTDLNLPTSRPTQQVSADVSSQTLPLAPGDASTVGIQFAGTGSTVAIIHHTGINDLSGAALPTSEHFEIVRGATFSIVQWREGARITGNDGQPIDFEDLNGNPQVRNELFVLICGEVNALVPPDRRTACGPAVAQAKLANARTGGRARSLVLSQKTLSRRATPTRHRSAIRSSRLTKSRVSRQPTGRRLIRGNRVDLGRRHVGRVTIDR